MPLQPFYVGLSEGVCSRNDYNRSGPKFLLRVVCCETCFQVLCLANVSDFLGVAVIASKSVIGSNVVRFGAIGESVEFCPWDSDRLNDSRSEFGDTDSG